MKAWLATDVVGFGAGLGKMDIIVILLPNGNFLVIKVTRDGRVWVCGETDEQPGPEYGFQNIEIDDELVEAVNASFDKNGRELCHDTVGLLIKFVKKTVS